MCVSLAKSQPPWESKLRVSQGLQIQGLIPIPGRWTCSSGLEVCVCASRPASLDVPCTS